MMKANKIPSYPSPKVDSNIFQSMTFFSPPGSQPRPTSSAKNPTVPARPNPRCPLVSLAGEDGLMAGEVPKNMSSWALRRTTQKTDLKIRFCGFETERSLVACQCSFCLYWLLFGGRHCQPQEGSSLTRVQLQAKAKVAIASDSDGSADFWGVAGWEMALSVGFGKDKAMVTDCSRAPC